MVAFRAAMSIPTGYDHRCRDCGAYYVPFEEDVRCPRCGVLERVPRFDLLSAALVRAREYLREHGTLSPPSFLAASLGDHVLHVALSVVDRHREEGGLDLFETFAEDVLDDLEWADQEYLRDHILDFAKRLEARLGEDVEVEGMERLG